MTIAGFGDHIVAQAIQVENAFNRLLVVVTTTRPMTNDTIHALRDEIDRRTALFCMTDNSTLAAIQSVIDDITHQRWRP